MIQFLADHIDQLDLALDQLAMRDRNFDRFAMMLIDNVVELALHKNAQDRAAEEDGWGRFRPPKCDPKLVAAALKQHFDDKVKLARATNIVTPEVAETIQYLHRFRNAVYHAGLKHEGILHSLAIFYFENACEVLEGYRPLFWSWGSNDQIPYRATKYLARPEVHRGHEVFRTAWARLREVARSMGDSLVADITADMVKTIESVNGQLEFLASDALPTRTRDQVVVDCQVWPFAVSDEGRQYAVKNGCAEQDGPGYVKWMEANFTPAVRTDPVAAWEGRAASLKSESNKHLALKKYADFMSQTQELRAHIEEGAAELDAHIQLQIDISRGK